MYFYKKKPSFIDRNERIYTREHTRKQAQQKKHITSKKKTKKQDQAQNSVRWV